MDLRKLDALVAEKVMGWSNAGPPENPLIVPPLDHEAIRNHWAAEWDEHGCPHWMPRYSSDISAAWEVVEAMGGHHNFFLQSSHDQWSCSFDGGPEVHDVQEVTLAICLAALKAKGIELP